MATQLIPVLHKGTETPGKVPVASDLMERQLVMNLADGKLWSKNSSGQIIQFGVSLGDFAPVAFSGSYNDLTDKPTIINYTLPPATGSTLGGIKVGSGLSAIADGTLSAAVVSVRGQDGTAKTGAVVITRADLGLDILDVNNKILPQYLPDSITGAMVYQGTYDASTNTPALPAAAAGNLGWLYVVSVAGTTTPPGQGPITVNVSDWLISDGTEWQHISQIQPNVLSVQGKTGTVTLTLLDFPDASVVARTGSYTDLINVPTTFPPEAHTQPASSITGLAPVATSGDYNDLTNLPPDPSISLVGFNAIGAPVLQGNVRYPFARQVKFSQNWAGSAAFFTLFTGNTATVQLNRIRSGVSTNVGSIQYTLNTDTVVFSSVEVEPTFLAQDQMEWVWPSNIAQFTVNMLGTRFV